MIISHVLMDNTCSICFEDIQDEELHTTMCQPIPHCFHRNCWCQWERACTTVVGWPVRCAYCNQPQRPPSYLLAQDLQVPHQSQRPIIHIDTENMELIRELREVGARTITLNGQNHVEAELAYCPDRNMFICHTNEINRPDRIRGTLKSLVSRDRIMTRRIFHEHEIRQFDNKFIMIGPLPEVWQADGSMMRRITTVSPEQAIALTQEHLGA